MGHLPSAEWAVCLVYNFALTLPPCFARGSVPSIPGGSQCSNVDIPQHLSPCLSPKQIWVRSHALGSNFFWHSSNFVLHFPLYMAFSLSVCPEPKPVRARWLPCGSLPGPAHPLQKVPSPGRALRHHPPNATDISDPGAHRKAVVYKLRTDSSGF